MDVVEIAKSIFEGVSTYFCIYRVSTNTIFTMCRNTGVVGLDMERTQEVGGTLIGEDGLMVMAGEELVEWYQIHQTHGFSIYYEPSSRQQPPLV
jgi:hypothetical protein